MLSQEVKTFELSLSLSSQDHSHLSLSPSFFPLSLGFTHNQLCRHLFHFCLNKPLTTQRGANWSGFWDPIATAKEDRQQRYPILNFVTHSCFEQAQVDINY